MRMIIFLSALAAVAFGLYEFDGLRNTMLSMNGGISVGITKKMTDNTLYIAVADMAPAKWALLIFEALIAAAVLSALIRGIAGMGVRGTLKGVREHTTLPEVITAISVGGSITMAIYAYRVLWGAIPALGLSAINPPQLSYFDGGWLGIVGGLYAFTQYLPLVFTKANKVVVEVIDAISSFSVIGVIGFAWLSYFGGSYPWTTHRLEAMEVWGIFTLFDVMNMIVASKLLLTNQLFAGSGAKT